MPDCSEQEKLYRIALTLVPQIGPRTGRVLLEHLGSAEAVFNTPIKQLKIIEGIGEVRVKGFKDPELMKTAEQEMRFATENGIRILCLGFDYPQRLTNCADAPLVLFYKGHADLDAGKTVAIVGTRRNTDYGHKLCEDLVDGLQSLEDVVVVSGMALGIDGIAHKKCVQLGIPTVGVLGHGLDMIYPHSHKLLAAQMTEQGGLLTEFLSGTLPDRNNFPMRNRVVAGICDVTVVVESHTSGGALITAGMAAGYNREVAAFPGRVNDSRSAGCNQLIRNNIAALINSAEELAELMNWTKNKKPKAVQTTLFLNFTPEEQHVVNLLQTKESVHADELLHHTGLGSSMLAATLLQLEMLGIIKTLPGKLYRMQ